MDVERATKGVRSTESLNWVKSYGLVDADDRTSEQLEELRDAGIYGLDCYSVGSLNYHPEMISRLAMRQAQITRELKTQVNSEKRVDRCIGEHSAS